MNVQAQPLLHRGTCEMQRTLPPTNGTHLAEDGDSPRNLACPHVPPPTTPTVPHSLDNHSVPPAQCHTSLTHRFKVRFNMYEVRTRRRRREGRKEGRREGGREGGRFSGMVARACLPYLGTLQYLTSHDTTLHTHSVPKPTTRSHGHTGVTTTCSFLSPSRPSLSIWFLHCLGLGEVRVHVCPVRA